MRRYRTVFNREALEFVVHADEREFAEIERWVDHIERAPSTPGDFIERHDDGRELQVMALDRVVVTYWADDAEREVRVVKIESLGRSG